MPPRRLNPEEQALWRQLTQGIRAFRARPRPAQSSAPESARGAPSPPDEPDQPPRRIKGRVPPPRPVPAPPPRVRVPVPVLDRGWERRIRAGQLQPDASIDLHGHTLASAHAALEGALTQAVAMGSRVLLVVTGKPRAGGAGERSGWEGKGRGAIRSEIGHWLDRSPLADRIASVRVAHPRHGGDGALYVILRRDR